MATLGQDSLRKLKIRLPSMGISLSNLIDVGLRASFERSLYQDTIDIILDSGDSWPC
jgi:hypothetical protein